MMAVVMNNIEARSQTKAAKALAAKSAPSEAAKSSGLKSEQIFGMMATYLSQGLGKPLIPKVDSVFGFEI
jgi:hypothetical protein